MARYLILGAGRFGLYLAGELQKAGAAVDVLDKEPTVRCQLPADCRFFCDNAWNILTLRDLDISAYDICYIAMAAEPWATAHIVDELRRRGARRIVARVVDEKHAREVMAAGADETICVEQLAGQTLARQAAL